MHKEIRIKILREGVDFVLSAFFSVGVYEFKIEDPALYSQILDNKLQWDYIEEHLNVQPKDSDIIELITYQDSNRVDSILAEFMKEISLINMSFMKSLEVSVIDYVSVDWLSLWKQYYKPLSVGKYIVIPIWEKENSKISPSQIPIFINPSYAFGTGEHESTKICLELMSGISFLGKTVADIGTGSGILGMAALKGDASACDFIDIDENSIKSAKENYFTHNGGEANSRDEMGAKATIKTQNYCLQNHNKALFLISNLLNELKNKKFDIILANITIDPILKLLENIHDNLNQNGQVIMSGILQKDEDTVIREYQNKGFSLKNKIVKDVWVGMLFELI